MHTHILFKLAFATIFALLLLSTPTVADKFDAIVKDALEGSTKASDSAPAVAEGGSTNDRQPPSDDTDATTAEDTTQQQQQQQQPNASGGGDTQDQQQPDIGSMGKNVKNPNADSKSYGECLSGCAVIVDSLTKSCKELCDPKKGSCYDECDQTIKTQLDGCKEDCKTQKDA